MSTAADRFVRARRAARVGTSPCPPGLSPDVWNAVLRTQRALRGLPPELTVPLWVAREWATQASGSAIKTIEAAEKNLDISPYIQALYGYYVVSPSKTLGPFNTEIQAIDAARAAKQHGMPNPKIQYRGTPEEVVRCL